MLIPEPIIWLGFAFLLVLFHFLLGLYLLRHRHNDAIFEKYVQQAISQGLSEEDANKAVSMHFVLENYLWPKVLWESQWKYKFKRK